MTRILIAICLFTLLIIARLAPAADGTQKADAAESKAEVLERDAAVGDSAPPLPSETITKPETQAVDPVGDKPLDDAVTCLARTIYWESKGEVGQHGRRGQCRHEPIGARGLSKNDL